MPKNETPGGNRGLDNLQGGRPEPHYTEWSASWLRESLSRFLELTDVEWFLVESAANLQADRVREAFFQASLDISGACDWTAVSRRPSHATLVQRRERPGPMLRTFDAEGARRWVATGSSEVRR